MDNNGNKLLQFVNCRILRNHSLIREDLWVRSGKIVNPEKIFFDEKRLADEKIDCKGCIIAPGFIELQINGGFGFDFSYNTQNVEQGLNTVAKNILAHGVTAFCPTLVTSSENVYHLVLPKIHKRPGGRHGAAILGVHAEGPFISKDKKGAHSIDLIQGFDKGIDTVKKVYGSLENIKIVTLAPELDKGFEVTQALTAMGITVSVGHSMANVEDGERAVESGATLITHLFNAMLPFHHRDPGLVGLLASPNIPSNKTVYYGIIADGIHTHPAALQIAYRTHPAGLILVTDAISAMGLEEGTHHIGQMAIEVREKRAYISGTNTLCGSIATMSECVQLFLKNSGCSLEYALEAASLHPALAIGIEQQKGTLNFGSDADFVMLSDNLDVSSTWIAGECVYP